MGVPGASLPGADGTKVRTFRSILYSKGYANFPVLKNRELRSGGVRMRDGYYPIVNSRFFVRFFRGGQGFICFHSWMSS